MCNVVWLGMIMGLLVIYEVTDMNASLRASGPQKQMGLGETTSGGVQNIRIQKQDTSKVHRFTYREKEGTISLFTLLFAGISLPSFHHNRLY